MNAPVPPPAPLKGRGAASNIQGRFEREQRISGPVDPSDSTDPAGTASAPITVVRPQQARRVLSVNQSPDLPFDQSLNPYLGCEHGCSYCYARPSYAYWGLSPGLDFETRIFAKTNAAQALRAELGARGYACKPITLAGNTDPYQPAEREQRITRAVLEVLDETSHPVSIITKNALVERDIDLLASLARRNLVHVYVSVTTWDNGLSARLEPRASAPHRRIAAIGRLAAAGVPVGVMVAPIIPALTDRFMETILQEARAAGAKAAGYVLLRLPDEVAPLFQQWLEAHEPLRAAHVMSLVRQMRGGKTYDARFRIRQTGTGPFADLVRRRFDLACRRLGYLDGRLPPLDTTAFAPPRDDGPQLGLF